MLRLDDDTIRAAAERLAGAIVPSWDKRVELFERALREAVEAEREACAQIADTKESELWPTVDGGMGTRAASEIAEDIRGRGRR